MRKRHQPPLLQKLLHRQRPKPDCMNDALETGAANRRRFLEAEHRVEQHASDVDSDHWCSCSKHMPSEAHTCAAVGAAAPEGESACAAA